MKKNTSGFTVVELLIVVVVIGILAVISVVAYAGIQDQARASRIASLLNQAKSKLELHKVDNGSYPNTDGFIGANIVGPGDIKYQYSSAEGSHYCLTAINFNITYRVTDNDVPPTGSCSGHAWGSGVRLVNLVTNGDFSSGVSGWYGFGVTIASSGGRMSAIRSGPYGATVWTTPLPQNHIVYSRASIEGTTTNYMTHQRNWGGGQDTATHLSSNGLGIISTQFLTGSNSFISIGDAAQSNWLGYYVDNVVVVDLTSAFGAGNEPSKSQMDQIMQQFPGSWFSGTVTADTEGII